jgi:hypothetical protein
MQADVTAVTSEIYRECGRSIACRRAADYYVALVRNPCYPPAEKMTQTVRKYYMEIIEKYGLPRCDVKALVAERLRGTALEKYVDEIAELAERIRKNVKITSRVAAAAATIVVAEWHACCIIRKNVAALYGVSYNAVKSWLPYAHFYMIEIAWKRP